MSTDVIATKTARPVRQIPFILRVIWFFALGWELTGAWILIAWVFNITILGLPVGLWMIDRVPQVLTLRMRPGVYVVDTDNGRSRFLAVKQPNILLRTIYFALFGWWFSLVWAALAWILCATIIGLPFGIPMLHTLPFVTTLHRG